MLTLEDIQQARERMGAAGHRVVERERGAVTRILDRIGPLLR